MERGTDLDRAAAASALRWWADAGVDTLVREEPRDWLKPRVPAAPIVPPPLSADDALPGQLDLFHAWLQASDTLPFHAPGASRLCPAGDPASGLMILTDMPAGEDCGAGTLIAGEAGRLFDRMLAAIGRDRASVYLAALSCLRSPDGRFTVDAARCCADLARHHIGLVRPKAVLLFGDACGKAMLGQAVAQGRGRWHDIETPADMVKALLTFSPSFLLSQPAAKARAWADLQMLMRELAP